MFTSRAPTHAFVLEFVLLNFFMLSASQNTIIIAQIVHWYLNFQVDFHTHAISQQIANSGHLGIRIRSIPCVFYWAPGYQGVPNSENKQCQRVLSCQCTRYALGQRNGRISNCCTVNDLLYHVSSSYHCWFGEVRLNFCWTRLLQRRIQSLRNPRGPTQLQTATSKP